MPATTSSPQKKEGALGFSNRETATDPPRAVYTDRNGLLQVERRSGDITYVEAPSPKVGRAKGMVDENMGSLYFRSRILEVD